MNITVNGQSTEVSKPDATIVDLIEQLDLKGRAVAVEVNKKLVPKREHATTKLSDNDIIELVTLVGGG